MFYYDSITLDGKWMFQFPSVVLNTNSVDLITFLQALQKLHLPAIQVLTTINIFAILIEPPFGLMLTPNGYQHFQHFFNLKLCFVQ